jgi:beta-glucanase (GH16 family)
MLSKGKMIGGLIALSFLISIMNISCSSNIGGGGGSGMFTNLVWSDEFNDTNATNLSWIWNIRAGALGYGNSELQNYTSNNFSFVDDGSGTNGVLLITASNTSGYTSCRIDTVNNASWDYARFSARIRLDVAGQGAWPAFWLIGASGVYNKYTGTMDGWPMCGEIDIMESGKDGDFNNIGGTVHWGTDWNQGHHYSGGSAYSTTFASEYHVFDVEKTPGGLKWYLDGSPYFYESLDGKDGSDFRQGFSIILNLAIGGQYTYYTGYGIAPDNSKFPKKMYVDYVRVYQ